MDDIFNPNPINEKTEGPEVNPFDNAVKEQTPVSEKKPEPTPNQAPIYNAQNVNPYPYRPNPAPNVNPNQPAPQMNRTAQPYYPTAPVVPQPPQKKKKKTSAGKIVFVTLICLSVILSSVAVGISLSATNNDTSSNEPLESQNKPTIEYGSGATPTVEDSPVSFSEYSGSGAMTPEQIYNSVKDINVGVLVYSQDTSAGEGSGIIVGTDAAGKSTYVLTAAHVIADSGITVKIQLNNGSEYDAEIVGFDTKTDVGVLVIEGTGFKAATFGNSDSLNVGQKIYAIGNPGGTEFFGSFTSGLISAIDRPVPTTNSSYDLPCIQHNAAINPGNSGGALVNEYGQVIGLNSSKISSTEYEGMGFSVPSNTVLEVYNEIITHGYVTNRPMLGITYLPISANYSYNVLAEKNGLPYGSIVISTINPESDMANHDVEVGDIITAVNGKELETTDVLLETIENAKVGDKLKLTICRLNNKGSISSTFDVTVTLVEDKGNTVIPEEETETNPFKYYFEDFGY